MFRRKQKPETRACGEVADLTLQLQRAHMSRIELLNRLEQANLLLEGLINKIEHDKAVVDAAYGLGSFLRLVIANEGKPVSIYVDESVKNGTLYKHAFIERMEALVRALESGTPPQYKYDCTNHMGESAEWFVADKTESVH